MYYVGAKIIEVLKPSISDIGTNMNIGEIANF